MPAHPLSLREGQRAPGAHRLGLTDSQIPPAAGSLGAPFTLVVAFGAP